MRTRVSNLYQSIGGFIRGLLDEMPPICQIWRQSSFGHIAKKGLALKKTWQKDHDGVILKVAPMSVADFLTRI